MCFSCAFVTARRTRWDVYNSRALEWFECGPDGINAKPVADVVRGAGGKGRFPALVEAQSRISGRARDMTTCCASLQPWNCKGGRGCVSTWKSPERDRQPVVRGYTIHAFHRYQGKPIRPPAWFVELLGKARKVPPSSAKRNDDDRSPPRLTSNSLRASRHSTIQLQMAAERPLHRQFLCVNTRKPAFAGLRAPWPRRDFEDHDGAIVGDEPERCRG